MASKSILGNDDLSPEDIMDIPELRDKAHKLGWTRETIGMLYWAGLLEGVYIKKLRKCFIKRASLIELFRRANDITKKRLIDFDTE